MRKILQNLDEILDINLSSAWIGDDVPIFNPDTIISESVIMRSLYHSMTKTPKAKKEYLEWISKSIHTFEIILSHAWAVQTDPDLISIKKELIKELGQCRTLFKSIKQ